MKKQTDGELAFKFGKMVRGINSVLLDEGELSDAQNMRPGFWWKQRKGMNTLTATPVASGLVWKKITQFRKLDGGTDVLLAHAYDSSGGEVLYQGSALPPNSITWSSKYTMTASCENAQFANVAEAILMANNKEILIWRGTSHKPTGVWLYDAGNDEYLNYFDEMTDSDTSTIMVIDSLTTSDFIYVLSEMPLDTINWVCSAYNSNPNQVIIYKWNGSWTELTVTDGTSGTASVELDDDFTGVAFDTTRWTETDASGDLTCNGEYIYDCTGGAVDISSEGKVTLTGDFDISVAFSIGTGDFLDPGTGSHQHALYVYQDAANWTYVRMEHGGTQRYAMDGEVGGSGETAQFANTSDTSGYMRLVRSGSSISAYYGSATAGTLIGTFTSQYTGDVYVKLYSITGMDNSKWDGPGTFDDLQLNSGTVAVPSLAQDGAMTWTVATDEVATEIEGIPGFAYKIGWSAALDSEVEVSGITVHSPWGEVKNVWDGTTIPPTGCYVNDGTKFIDFYAYVNNTSQSQYCDLGAFDTSSEWYIGFSQQVNRILVWPTEADFNDADCEIADIEYMANDGSWTSVGTVTDTTQVGNDMLQQKGSFSWVAPTDEVPSKVGGDDVQMYWYRVTIDANSLTDPTYVYYIQGVPVVEDPDYSFGVFAYKRRAWQIAPKGDENAVRYSAQDLPNVWNGPDSGYVYFGERPLKAAAPFYNESVIYADTEIWMLQGNTPANFGRLRLSGKVGISATDSLVSIETGAPVGDKIKVVLAWFFYDGIWLFDGTRIWKVSSPDVDNFFDPDHADYINMTYMDETKGEFDFETQCAYWTVYSGSGQTTPNKVIVMHFPTMTFSVYAYGTDIGAVCSVINSRYYLCGGDSNGRFFELNNGTTDRDSSNSEVAVDAYLTTRDMPATVSDGMKQRLFTVWAEQQDAGGFIEVDEYPDGSDTPQAVGKANMTTLGKIASVFQWPLKVWTGQKLTKFRIRNRSKNARMNLMMHSTTIDKSRSDQ